MYLTERIRVRPPALLIVKTPGGGTKPVMTDDGRVPVFASYQAAYAAARANEVRVPVLKRAIASEFSSREGLAADLGQFAVDYDGTQNLQVPGEESNG